MGLLADRTAVEDIKPLAATLIQSELLGAQMRTRVAPPVQTPCVCIAELHAEEDAQKASIKILFPLVIFVLPSMIGGNHRTGNDLGPSPPLSGN